MVEHAAPTVDGGSKPTPSLHFIEIPKQKATDLIIQNHYLHRRCPISFSWGIETSNDIVGVLTVGKPASWSTACGLVGETKLDMKDPAARTHDVYELNRLWLSDSLPRNSESQFISWCLRELRKKNPSMILVSYADGKQGHVGYVYQATNWIYTGSSTPFVDIAVEGFEDYRSVPQYLRGGFIYKCTDDGEFDSPYTEDEKPSLTRPCPWCGNQAKKTNKRDWSRKEVLVDKEGKSHKISRITRSIKHRYVWFANQKDRNILHWDIQPYPKKAA
jgi:hypothetical protein